MRSNGYIYPKRCEEADHLVHYIYNLCKNPLRNGDVNVKIVAQHYCGNVITKLVFNKRFFGGGMEDGGPGVEKEEHAAGIFTIVACVHGFNIVDYVPRLESFDVNGHKAKLRNAI
ncbi:hypothetical protein BUALT_Bualt14G0008700 [Buddleja alternifolia]|uniref:Uncharacterized protein n=1 Tax=Buddleja alternifolia TaxID=168488 RepID=A0AAV6WQX7_9LAMI|nr:hypothetical protein BUALT_Bualt14G0008700 [Buddleja alternifolia]